MIFWIFEITTLGRVPAGPNMSEGLLSNNILIIGVQKYKCDFKKTVAPCWNWVLSAWNKNAFPMWLPIDFDAKHRL